MVVGEDDSGAVVKRGGGNNRPEREVGPALVPGMARQVDAIGFVIEVRDPQAFARGVRIRDAAGEEGPGGGKAVELQWKFGTLIAHRVKLEDEGGKDDEKLVGSCAN